MPDPFKSAIGLCNTIARNGYEAYIINARMQQRHLASGNGDNVEIALASDLAFDELIKIFPHALPAKSNDHAVAVVDQEGIRFRFYPADFVEGSHPEITVARVTRGLLDKGGPEAISLTCQYLPRPADQHEDFEDLRDGEIAFRGIPDETLRRNYLLGIRAMRFAANYQLPIEANSWISIIRNRRRILDYTPINEIMDEWRQVEAENLHYFVELLDASMVLHSLVPEVAALKKLTRKSEDNELATEFELTLEIMRRYPEELPYDWYGTMACMFHAVGKLYTAELFEGEWMFHQYPRVGSKIARKILRSLGMDPQDTDLICHLVRYHDRFTYMLNDKGIRRFRALDEYPRLIEIARAMIKASGGNYAAFNHNMKLLDRADIPEEMLEPLLNGNEIMDFAGLKPGPMVGRLRDALLQAQIAGDVTNVPEAVAFVQQRAGSSE
ncbi:HD family phosphohydrolase [Oceanidesulfovibrio marinus]|uniref:HD family phosphohydrolase n=1 Tax=Oceanidesulfovibrio marinus TaxID=370038 RepID=A0A6P1ZL16_9BACT|nr:HD family phosphohydrolase [Oceanidesulfovibrio marinus]QJT10086.1 HD family phosphohydrolase [Oceanidesulfovibrio marinus]TVM35799.1 HD family phosphohydrolase [Oceanidesulfovibrio marinus]